MTNEYIANKGNDDADDDYVDSHTDDAEARNNNQAIHRLNRIISIVFSVLLPLESGLDFPDIAGHTKSVLGRDPSVCSVGDRDIRGCAGQRGAGAEIAGERGHKNRDHTCVSQRLVKRAFGNGS